MSSKCRASILVVDDDRAFRLSTSALLRQEGYEVSAVSDGQQALDVAREGRVDLFSSIFAWTGPTGCGSWSISGRGWECSDPADRSIRYERAKL